jgi:hypothetical protein
VDPVTGRELGEHPALILRIPENEPTKTFLSLKHLFEGSKVHAEAAACNLYKTAGKAAPRSEQLEGLRHSFTADNPNFHCVTVGKSRHVRSHS